MNKYKKRQSKHKLLVVIRSVTKFYSFNFESASLQQQSEKLTEPFNELVRVDRFCLGLFQWTLGSLPISIKK